MKRWIALCGLLLAVFQAPAQEVFYGTFNRLGAHVDVGTEGIGVGVASPLTPYLEVSLGMNVMPGIKVKADIDVGTLNASGVSIPVKEVEAKGNFGRTMLDFKVNCYPFGTHSSFFVAAGFSFGGKTVAELSGHSQEVAGFIANHPEMKGKIVAAIDEYNIKFDDNGNVSGRLEAAGFRPYLVLGFGRLVPKHRMGARFEMGCQFHGKIKVMQDNQEVVVNKWNDGDNDFSKIVDKIRVYPVLKFSLVGRIL